jgi:hypothetical protein
MAKFTGHRNSVSKEKYKRTENKIEKLEKIERVRKGKSYRKIIGSSFSLQKFSFYQKNERNCKA